MYRIILWIAIGIVLALVAVYRIPVWPTARSTGTVEHCTNLTEPVTRAVARQELERHRRAAADGTDAERLSRRTGEVAETRRAGAVYSATRQNELADADCVLELEQIASGERLSAARGEWLRVTGLILIISIGLLIALYLGRMAALKRGWMRRR
ncbi:MULTISPECIES: hypothetical protein [unclassified Lysobacter]|uniref:hypothetical protein n=1 Tax=unclassified Lysobacter TaxID=2635362 RepID=UPI001C22032E|nr:hypothetical protein [Lysobacter sp. MMG2]MBU8976500.1 hypothetical protein [Lysobacter sp. MMG2]